MRNHLKTLLKNGGTAVGAWNYIMDPEAIRILANSGLDWIFFDTEHGASDLETVDSMIQVLKGVKAIPLVRVIWNDISAIKKALDTGAYGVIVP